MLGEPEQRMSRLLIGPQPGQELPWNPLASAPPKTPVYCFWWGLTPYPSWSGLCPGSRLCLTSAPFLVEVALAEGGSLWAGPSLHSVPKQMLQGQLGQQSLSQQKETMKDGEGGCPYRDGDPSGPLSLRCLEKAWSFLETCLTPLLKTLFLSGGPTTMS